MQRVNNQASSHPLGVNEESFEALLNKAISPLNQKRPKNKDFRVLLKLHKQALETSKAQDRQCANLQDTIRQLKAEIRMRSEKESLLSRRLAELEAALEKAEVRIPPDRNFMMVGGNRVRIT